MDNDLGSFLVFRELTVRGLYPALERLGEAIQEHLPAHWRRDKAKEQENASMFGDRSLLVFERDGSGGLPASGVAMLTEGEKAEVINIVPLEKSQLSAQEYNAVLVELTKSAIQPAAVALGIKCELTDDQKPFTVWVSPAAGEALQRFSILANHGTGSAHPLDRERWFAFLLQCHRDRCELDTDMLRRWLMEQGGWTFERASDLVIEYEFGRGLLKFAEQNA
ncbi:hypothetical protein [Zoogloea sp. LCSB751]|uniref:hypothetical protein n=1 Tax=Zoogloea sp. LCSB751 TaxID=1965277 RepID=UPI0009A520E4|nr:hypothetical protein [Zoogloea sp. LCSB751]